MVNNSKKIVTKLIIGMVLRFSGADKRKGLLRKHAVKRRNTKPQPPHDARWLEGSALAQLYDDMNREFETIVSKRCSR